MARLTRVASLAVVLFTVALATAACAAMDATPSPTAPAPTLSPPVAQAVLTAVAPADYLATCLQHYPPSTREQATFQGVQPGVTTTAQLEALWGPPDKKNLHPHEENWVYGGMGLIIERDAVSDLLVQGGQAELPTVGAALRKFGCPDIVMAVEVNEEPTGYYDRTLFVFHHAGVEVQFAGYPVDLTSPTEHMLFFVPMELEEYLEEGGWTVLSSVFGMPVDWEEAVKEGPAE